MLILFAGNTLLLGKCHSYSFLFDLEIKPTQVVITKNSYMEVSLPANLSELPIVLYCLWKFLKFRFT